MRKKKEVALLFVTLLSLLFFKFNDAPFVCASEVVTEDIVIWNERYDTKKYIFGTKPLKFLKENVDRLPKGRAFVVAMGEGRNAVYLAKNGFVVEGCDSSQAAIDKANKLAAKKSVRLHAFVADMVTYEMEKDEYDLITCFYYLQRDLIPQIKDGLRKGGIVMFETYTVDQLTLGSDVKGPKNRDYLLEHNELLDFFRDFRVIFYEETIVDNKKAVARLIAEKR